MIELVHGRTVQCELDGTRTYDRRVGICYRGVARDCPRYSGGRYAQAERRAAANGATIAEVYALPGTVGDDNLG